ncbi:DNA binding protein [Auricularia subglabra TFB-10046 SS5]|nr:DNA binding protein [Auricularia subglabra TFB-10046 SS5]
MSDEDESYAPNAPKPIHRLDEALIIHRPSSALKELLENALDAGSTAIQLIVKDGGLKLLQLRDNGCGIRREDLPILAERFTTSKLSQFDDLRSLETYGFRGEALASISFVAQLSVVTKTKAESCAWKACYANGALVPQKAGQTAEPKPCAGTDGTIITVENLFYNTPVRLAALRNPSDEYGRLLDVMTKYAVHKPSVSFTCRKSGASQPDLHTPGSPSTRARDNIHKLYGASVSSALIPLEANEEGFDDSSMAWHYDALCSNASYAGKSLKLILFINGRLVDSQPFRRAIESVYAPILAKGSHPFVYLSLGISPECLDVNVHPTKREVRFLHEDDVVERFTIDLAAKLAEQAQSRPFAFNTQKTQSRLQDDMLVDEEEDEQGSDMDEEPLPPSTQEPRRVYSQHKVRTSNKDRSLDSMLPAASSDSAAVRTESGGPGQTTAPIAEASTTLLSILNLRKAVKEESHSKLQDILCDHTYVGLVDARRALSLVQHGTRLYLLNHAIISEELFYQLGLRQFSAYPRVALNPAPPLRRIIRIGLDVELKQRPSKLSAQDLEDKIYKVLMKRREMLDAHFGIRISADGELQTLPMLLPGYVPNMTKLPLFAMRLGPQVDWSDEEQCFRTLLRELATFYSLAPAMASKDKSSDKDLAWQVQHLILARCRTDVFDPPAGLLDHAVVEVANLPALYRVFERC